ncbi:MAG: hypothetical protein ACP5E5_00350 [Acidobacteriaceae bacterium]
MAESWLIWLHLSSEVVRHRESIELNVCGGYCVSRGSRLDDPFEALDRLAAAPVV